eukprot:4851586-Pleurochrysis_carterae.AAC.1
MRDAVELVCGVGSGRRFVRNRGILEEAVSRFRKHGYVSRCMQVCATNMKVVCRAGWGPRGNWGERVCACARVCGCVGKREFCARVRERWWGEGSGVRGGKEGGGGGGLLLVVLERVDDEGVRLVQLVPVRLDNGGRRLRGSTKSNKRRSLSADET